MVSVHPQMIPWTVFLDGKARKTSLAVFHGPPPPDAPPIRRLVLGQGELAHFWDGEFPIHYLAFLELKPDTTRGNHFHRRKRELLYLISGELEVLLEDVASRKRISVPMVAGDLIDIQTNVAHAYRVRGSGQAMEFAESKFDGTDTFPFRLG